MYANSTSSDSRITFVGHQSAARSEVIPCKRWNLDQWLHPKNCKGRNTVIAIIDGGIDNNHCCLSAKYNNGQIQGRNFVPNLTIDPITNEAKINVDPVTNSPVIDPNLWCGDIAKDEHGTAVAAIAGGYNYGVAPDATLYICRIFHGGVQYAELIDPLKHILELKQKGHLSIDIVCMSHGSKHRNRDVEDQLLELIKNGIVCVAAVGNEGLFQKGAKFPASDLLVLSVGSLRPLGQESDQNPSTGVNIFAPGEDIVCPSLISPTSIKLMDGSSFATPMVAGFLSLLIQCANELEGSTPSVVKEYHNIRFLVNLLLDPDEGPCDHGKLIFVERFLKNLIEYSVNRYGEPKIVSLIKYQDPNFQP